MDQVEGKHIEVKAGGKLKANDIAAETFDGEAEKNVDLGKMKVTKEATVKSKTGDVSLLDKVDAEKMKISAANSVNLVADGAYRADHKFGSLSIDCKKMDGEKTKQLLEGSDVFKSMEVRDSLDLAMTDERLILGNLSRNCSLSLKFKEIDIIGKVSTSKSFRAEAENDVSLQRGAEVKSAGSTELVSKKGSINMTAATVQGNDVLVDAAKDVNILAYKTTDSRAEASYIKGGDGKEYGDQGRKKAVQIKAGRNVDVYASHVGGKGDVIMQAKGNITTRAATTERSHTTSKRSGLFGMNKTTTTTKWTDVDRSSIKSSGGKIIMHSEEGSITSTATDIHGKDSAYLHAKHDVKLLDLVTRKVTTTDSSSWWGLSNSHSEKTQELSAGTSLVTKSDDPSIIKSDLGNVLVEGSTIDCQGDLDIIAENGRVDFKERVLNTWETTETSSFNPLKMSFTAERANTRTQQVAGSSVNAKNLEVKAKAFKCEGLTINTIEDMVIDAEEVDFRGIRLESETSYESLTIGLKPTSLSVNIDIETRNSSAKEYMNQQTNVGGKMQFKNVKNVRLTDANINADEFASDTAINMEITSNVSTYTESSTKVGVEIGFSMVGGVAVPIPGVDIDESDSSAAMVKQASGIHSRKSITKDLKVKQLKMTGGQVTSKGDIEEFAEEVETIDVEEFQKSSSKSTSLKIGTDKGKVSNVSFGHLETNSLQKGVLKSSMLSGTGKVASKYQNRVNTDVNSIRQVTHKETNTKGFKTQVGKDGMKFQANEVGAGMVYSKDKGFEAEVKAKNFEASVGYDKGKGGKAKVKTATTEHSIKITKDQQTVAIKQGGKEFLVDVSKDGGEVKIGDGESGLHLKGNVKDKSAQLEVKGADTHLNIGASKKGANIDFKDGDNRFNVGADLEKQKANVNIKADGTEIGVNASNSGNASFNLNANGTEIGANASSSGLGANFQHGDTKFGLGANLNDKNASFNLNADGTEIGANASSSGVKANFQDGDTKFGLGANLNDKNASFNLNANGTEIGANASSSGVKANFQDGDTKFGLGANLNDKNASFNLNANGTEIGANASSSGLGANFQHGDTKFGLGANLSDKNASFNLNADGTEIGANASSSGVKANFQKDQSKLQFGAGKEGTNFSMQEGETKFKIVTDSKDQRANFSFKNNGTEIGGEAGRSGVKAGVQDKKSKLNFDADKEGVKLGLQEDDAKLNMGVDLEGKKLMTQFEKGEDKINFEMEPDFKEDGPNFKVKSQINDHALDAELQNTKIQTSYENGNTRINVETDLENIESSSKVDAKVGDFAINLETNEKEFKANASKGESSFKVELDKECDEIKVDTEFEVEGQPIKAKFDGEDLDIDFE
ncbi:hypothetical protein WR25_08943 [Diploscapter pachys]|uniref:Uncharacterized protein n=1 Tax=Diploscapter pachys TaxID=2018661 RepID=A0A2A2KKL8_9BILA|nr:hypothetical protein WR25_08943 [Diploscapter pachys]